MQLTTLGGLALRGSTLARPKTLLLMAYLALEGPQERRRLAELFWPHATDPRNRLSVNLTRMRRAASAALQADRQRVRLTLRTDVEALLDALEAGRTEEALGLYRGPFLDGIEPGDLGVELEEWIHLTREFVLQRVQEARIRRADRAASAGRFEAAAREAAAAFGLDGTVALEPETLQHLHTLLLAAHHPRAPQVRREAQPFGLSLAATREAARERLAPASPATLQSFPKRVTTLVGRATERLELARTLAGGNAPLVTLVGLPGAGKTRLAVQFAFDQHETGHFADGVHFVPLETLDAAAAVPAGIASALGLPPDQGRDPLRHVIDQLREKRMLLVLDNVEQIDDGAGVVAELVRHCPSLRLVVTSRERLGLEEEWPFLVEGLSFPRPEAGPEEARSYDAVALFVDRAARARPGYRLTPEDVPHVVEVCRLAEGNPLALELAAVWVSVLPVRDLAREIASNLDLLASPRRHVPERQRSLRGVFAQCWARLTPRERTGLLRLAVFQGEFGRDDALSVATVSLPLLAALVAKSLLRSLPDGRYARHPLMSLYTREKLAAEPEERERVEARHAAHFLARAEEANAAINAPEGGERLAHLERDHADLRAALAWADRHGEGAVLLRLGCALAEFWTRRGYHPEAIEWLRKGVARIDRDTHPRLYAYGVERLSYLCLMQGEYDQPREWLTESLARHRRRGDALGEARTLSHLGMLAVWQGDFATGQDRYERALRLADAESDERLIGRLLNNLGDVFLVRGQHTMARARYEEALAVERALGDLQMVSNVLGSLGMVLLRQGERAAARDRLGESLRLVHTLGIHFAVPTALEQFACWESAMGRPVRAARAWGAAEALREGMQVPLDPFVRPQYERDVADARQRTGAAVFAEAWREGRGTAREDAVRLALEATAAGPIATPAL